MNLTMRDPCRGLQQLPGADGGRADGPGRARLRHLFAAAQGTDHLPDRAGLRPGRRPDLRPAAVPGSREPEQGHLLLHQQPGRRGLGRAGDLRHHAVYPCPVSTVCIGQAASVGSLLLTAGAKGKRYALPNCPDDGPPALGRRPGPGDRHRDPGARDPELGHG